MENDIWQMQYLAKEKGYSSTSDTVLLDLPKNEQISYIVVEYKVGAGTDKDVDHSVLDAVTKVEVILEGSKVAYSMEPEMGSFIEFITKKMLPEHDIRHNRGDTVMRLTIPFGRFLKDPEYMLDTGLYASAQLQISYLNAAATEDVDSGVITAYYVRPVEKRAPLGFIRSRIIRTETVPAAGGEREYDLPVGLDWLNLGFRVFDYDEYPYSNVTDVKLDIDDGRLILFEGRFEELMTLQRMWYPHPVGYNINSRAADDDELETLLGINENCLFNVFGSACYMAQFDSFRGHHVDLKLQSASGTAVSSDCNLLYHGVGYLPHGGVVVGNFEKDIFPASTHNEAKLVLTCGTQQPLIQVFLQEVVKGSL